MVFKTQVRETAEKYLRDHLSPYPSQLIHLLRPSRFDLWVDLCWLRLNDLDVAGYVKNRFAVDHFIKAAVGRYAQVQLEKAALKNPYEKPDEVRSVPEAEGVSAL